MSRKNPKPLVLLFEDDIIYGCPTTQRWKDKGHEIDRYPVEGKTYDGRCGPYHWRIDPLIKLGDDLTVEESLERQLTMMEVGLRNIKYPKDDKND